MSAPINDNFTNATVISGDSGYYYGNNFNSTTESFEPSKMLYNPTSSVYQNSYVTASATSTVWFKWLCNPQVSSYWGTPWEAIDVIFSTCGNTGSHVTDFPSVIQVYSGSTITNISEVPYLLNQGAGYGNGYELGSMVSFTARSGSTYYVRIDSRYNQQGNYLLKWEYYLTPRLGTSASCTPALNNDWLNVGNAVFDTNAITSNASLNFGTSSTYPAGLYLIKWCRGDGWQDGDNGWSISNGEGGSSTFLLSYYNNGVAIKQPVTNPAGFSISPAQADIANNYPCTFINHSGGVISMSFYDNAILYDNRLYLEVPIVFALGQLNTFQTSSGAFTATTPTTITNEGGTNWSGSFSFNANLEALFNQNGCVSYLIPVSASLLSQDGVSNSSTTSSIIYNGTNTLNFSFAADMYNVFSTAILELTYQGIVIATISYPLYPIITLGVLGTSGGGNCGAGNPILYSVNYQCSMQSIVTWTSNINLVGTSTPCLPVSSLGNCPITSSISSTIAFSNNTTNYNALHYKCGYSASQVTPTSFSVGISTGNLTYPTYNCVYTVES